MKKINVKPYVHVLHYSKQDVYTHVLHMYNIHVSKLTIYADEVNVYNYYFWIIHLNVRIQISCL